MLRGDRIELMLPLGKAAYLATGQVSGERIEGTIDVAGRKLPFTATRTAPGRAVGWPE